MKALIHRRLLAVIAAFLVLQAPSNAHPTTSTLRIPLAETVSVPIPGGEDTVILTGTIHVITHITQPGDPVFIHISLSGVSGIGVSGLRYAAVPDSEVISHIEPLCPLPESTGSCDFAYDSNLRSGNRNIPLTLTLGLFFNSDSGELTDAVVVALKVPRDDD